jgi:hypothetical protein
MEKLVNQLKTNSYIIIVLAILSLTWLLIDYFLLKGVLSDNTIELGYSWILIVISIVVVAIFHIWVFILIYYCLRVVIKFNSEKKNSEVTEINKSTENKNTEIK